MVQVGTPAIIRVRGGTPQSAIVGTGFATPLQIAVTDVYGNPASGASVTWIVPSGGASAVVPAVVTNASGMASVTATANLVLTQFWVGYMQRIVNSFTRPEDGGKLEPWRNPKI